MRTGPTEILVRQYHVTEVPARVGDAQTALERRYGPQMPNAHVLGLATLGTSHPRGVVDLTRQTRLVCLLLATVFLSSGVSKLVDHHAFIRAVAAYELLPGPGNLLVAYSLPPLEVLCGILLIMPASGRVGLMAGAVMLVVFIAVVLSAMCRGLVVDCGCELWPGYQSPVGWPVVARNVVLLLLAVYGGLGLRTRGVPSSAAQSGGRGRTAEADMNEIRDPLC